MHTLPCSELASAVDTRVNKEITSIRNFAFPRTTSTLLMSRASKVREIIRYIGIKRVHKRYVPRSSLFQTYFTRYLLILHFSYRAGDFIRGTLYIKIIAVRFIGAILILIASGGSRGFAIRLD